MWKVGQNIRIEFTEQCLEEDQSLDCQIAGILRREGEETLLLNIPKISLYFAGSGTAVLLRDLEYVCASGVVMGVASSFWDKGDRKEIAWFATVEPLSDREPC
jgi:hypothetical protein